ncbi:hypothetical protein GDO78_017041 [Eleutherodactylus coqui]|uniref:RING-type domain-containing protein n=1 Tax=Eleutherodactylus coqui TaxID=57060 RepID=A0A8J6BM48_ELECQ|nr:hypothetical protein GDO78_017041 [Eleutherodactylus coqui]
MEYTKELHRLASFAPFSNTSVSSYSLAKAGFYYTGEGDSVTCFTCGLLLNNWKAGDNAVEKHKTFYPTCSFIAALFTKTQHSTIRSAVQNLSINCNELQNSNEDLYSAGEAAEGASTATTLYYTGGSDAENASETSKAISSTRTSTNIRYGTGYNSFEAEILADELLHPDGWRASQTETDCYLYTISQRMETFVNWPHSLIRSNELSKAGFYYTGRGDTVTCYSCKGTLNKWKAADNALEKHNVCFPSGFAEAGLYYIGKADNVRCFSCAIGLCTWEEGDDPWTEHARWSPKCEYIHAVKGAQFVKDVQERFLRDVQNTPSENEENNPAVTNILLTGYNYVSGTDVLKALQNLSPPNKTAPCEARKVNHRLLRRYRIVLSQRMTAWKQILDALAPNLAEAEKTYIAGLPTIALRCAAIIDSVIADGPSTIEAFVNALQRYDPTVYEQVFGRCKIAVCATDIYGDLDVQEQLITLQEERTCKVCIDNEANMLFIPCGHLITCMDCCVDLKVCPVCRKSIVSTMRAYLG